jgi:hypothetical protein
MKFDWIRLLLAIAANFATAFASINVRGFGKVWIPASAGMSGEFFARSSAGDDSSADQVLAAIQQP